MSSYLPRLADAVLAEMLREHPALLVTGPRAAGKTTSASRLAASAVRLADARERTAFVADIEDGLSRRPEPLLVDEWQEVPATLGHIKTLVDEDPRPGRFMVTSSVRGDIDGVTWPGTGRLVRLEIFGLTERELAGRVASAESPATSPTPLVSPGSSGSWLENLLRGDVGAVTSELRVRDYLAAALRSGFPEPALGLSAKGRGRWLSSYVDQLVTRDALGVDAGRDPIRLRRFLTAYALNSAGIADDATIYGAAGLSKNTARAYDQLLKNLLITAEVPAWTSNRLRRLTLASKRYLVDPGLFVGVLGVDEAEVSTDGDLLGRVIETFVMAQLRAEFALMTPRPRLRHLRSAEGRHEVDVIVEVGARRLIALEIKATSTPRPDDAKHLRWLKQQLGESVVAAAVLHCGPSSIDLGGGVTGCPISALWS